MRQSTSPVELLRDLYDTYYAAPRQTGDHLSSHWNAFSERFDVRVTPEGVPLTLSGYGFGDAGRQTSASRVFTFAGVLAQLARLPDRGRIARLLPVALRVAHRMDVPFTQDAFRQVCTVALLSRHYPDRDAALRILVIGDGYGLFSALFKALYPNATVMLVDLGKTLLFQLHHIFRAFPDAEHQLASGTASPNGDISTADFLYCPAEQLDDLPHTTVDLAVNIASMQEMTSEAVRRYFELLRALETRLFYCCNRLRKVLPGGEVQEILNYPWVAEDEHLVSELCPWHQWFVGRGSGSSLAVSGVPVPLVRVYDGQHWHRLTRLAAAEESAAPD